MTSLLASSSGCFLGRQGNDAQRVNVRLHQILERTVHELVPLQCPQPGEAAGDDVHPKMPFAVAGARVTGMEVTVVGQLDAVGVERLLELSADALGPICCCGGRAHC